MNSDGSSIATVAAAVAESDEIIFELPGSMRLHRSGRVERLVDDVFVPPSLDTTTGVESKDVVINSSTGLAARLYLPLSATERDTKLPVLIYFHGGGFCVLSSSSSVYHAYLNSLSTKANVLTVSVDYRLAPENPLPAAYVDAWETHHWVVSHAIGGGSEPWLSEFGNLDKIFLAGDSAGGNIVHNLGMRLDSEGVKVEGVVLVHPYFWGKERIGAEGDARKVSMRSVKHAEGLWPIVCPGTMGLDDAWINPVAESAPSLAALGSRRALVCVAELDLLRERGRVYYEKLKESGWGGEEEFVETDGEDHVFFLFKPNTVKAEAFRELLANFFNKA